MKEQVIEMLENLDERKMRLVFFFVLNMAKKS